MKSFFRVILRSFKYKWSIAGAVVCSLFIAALWSASLTTVYPFVEIIFQGHTIDSWLDAEMAAAEQRSDELGAEIEQLSRQLADAPADQRGRIATELDLKRTRLAAEQKARQWYQAVGPQIRRYSPATPFGTLVLVMGWLVVTSALKGVFLVTSSMLVARVANRTVMDLRRTYYGRALQLDQRRIDALGTSNLMTHLSHNMQMISGGLMNFYGKSIREPLKMISCLVAAALISWQLLIVSLLVVPAGAWLVHDISRRMKRSTQREVEGMAAVFQTLIETFGAIKTVRMFNREPAERRRFKRNANSLYRISLKLSFYDSLLRPATEMLGIISIALSILAGTYLVLNQKTDLLGLTISDRPLSPSLLMVFYALLAGASDPARKMSEIVNVLVRAGTASENLFRTFDVEAQVRSPRNPQALPLHRQSIRFEDVSFGYKPRQLALRNVTLEVPWRQTVAIVGGNGSGKTTLMNLLARFYDPHRGRIMIDSVDIRAANLKKLRQQLAWVTQDTVVFRGSLRENIAYGRLNATDQQVLDAARLACVDEFANQLPQGLDTLVGDSGTGLSAGQRQRIALARAVLADPRILILDEATSQLDGRTETLLHDAMREFLKARTTILITHRASSLALADRIIVMDAGQIAGDSFASAAGELPHLDQLFSRSA